MKKSLEIPIDYTGKPVITNKMKYKFIGEFVYSVEIMNEEGQECIADCSVPWTLCKKIYQDMALYAAYLKINEE